MGVGRQGWQTPVGKTKIIGKRKDPAWFVPESIRREHVYPPASRKKAWRARRKLLRELCRIERRYGVAVDWLRVRALLKDPRGIPFPILKGSPPPEAVLAQAELIPHPSFFKFRYTPPPLTPGWYLRHPEPLPHRMALRYARMLHHMAPLSLPMCSKKGGSTSLWSAPIPTGSARDRCSGNCGGSFPCTFSSARRSDGFGSSP